MIPIGDEGWDRRGWPIMTALLLAVNGLVFLYELQLQDASPLAVQGFLDRWGVVPVAITDGAAAFPQAADPTALTLFTSMFIHAGWLHLLGNMLYLWVFGDNVEDRMGRFGFLGFYLGAGLVAAAAQIAVDPTSRVPAVGASGAIAGVLGAYVVLFPHNRVRVLAVWIVIQVPALIVIGLWAVTQVVSGVGSLTASTAQETSGVAYMAHVGGFAAGLVGGAVMRLARPSSRPRTRPRYPLFSEREA